MDRLHPFAFVFARWRAEWRSVQIARTIYPTLWENVRRKIPETNRIELAEYANFRAAQLAQEQVDDIMQASPTLSDAFATRLLLRSANRAVNSVLRAVANSPRRVAT